MNKNLIHNVETQVPLLNLGLPRLDFCSNISLKRNALHQLCLPDLRRPVALAPDARWTRSPGAYRDGWAADPQYDGDFCDGALAASAREKGGRKSKALAYGASARITSGWVFNL